MPHSRITHTHTLRENCYKRGWSWVKKEENPISRERGSFITFRYRNREKCTLGIIFESRVVLQDLQSIDRRNGENGN